MQEREKDTGKGFDRISSLYIFLSRLIFGSSLLRSQFHFTDRIEKQDRVLILGVGTGQLLIKVLQQNKATAITCVDISEKMLQRARRLLQKEFPDNPVPVEFICCPAQDFSSACRFDLILLPYLLDCMTEPDVRTMLSNTKKQLQPNGKIILTDFRIPGTPFIVHAYAKLLLKILYLFFRIVCRIPAKQLPDFDLIFSGQGFHVKEEKTFYAGILFTQMYVPQLPAGTAAA